MALERIQQENLSKKELVEELVSVEDISSKLCDLNGHFDDFLRQSEIISVRKNCNHVLSERIAQLERKTVNNTQDHHR